MKIEGPNLNSSTQLPVQNPDFEKLVSLLTKYKSNSLKSYEEKDLSDEFKRLTKDPTYQNDQWLTTEYTNYFLDKGEQLEKLVEKYEELTKRPIDFEIKPKQSNWCIIH